MSKRIVVKIGTALLTKEDGNLDLEKLKCHVQKISTLISSGYQVILVSSGSIACGFAHLGYAERPDEIEAKQASAAVGQGLLIETYSNLFRKNNQIVAQVLLTRNDFFKRDSFNNISNTINLLIDKKALPIINENDLVSTKDIAFGDNDTLAALVASLFKADLLIILTDTDGVFDSDPKVNSDAKLITEIDNITEDCLDLAGDTGSKFGSGGMKSKLKAATLANNLGIKVFVGNGNIKSNLNLEKVFNHEEKGTYFTDDAIIKLGQKKQWLAFHSASQGKIIIDEGAKKALLEQGSSLLAVGIIDAFGSFRKNDIVEVYCKDDLIGKGAVNFSLEEVLQIKGMNSNNIADSLDSVRTEVIHRDTWVNLINFD